MSVRNSLNSGPDSGIPVVYPSDWIKIMWDKGGYDHVDSVDGIPGTGSAQTSDGHGGLVGGVGEGKRAVSRWALPFYIVGDTAYFPPDVAAAIIASAIGHAA